MNRYNKSLKGIVRNKTKRLKENIKRLKKKEKNLRKKRKYIHKFMVTRGIILLKNFKIKLLVYKANYLLLRLIISI